MLNPYLCLSFLPLWRIHSFCLSMKPTFPWILYTMVLTWMLEQVEQVFPPLHKKKLVLKDLAFYLNSVLHWTSWEDLAFLFPNSILNCLIMSCIWLSKAPIPIGGRRRGGDARISPPSLSLAGKGGTSSKPPSLISRDFPSNFTCSICFFLLTSCFLFLHFKSLQIVLLTSSWRAGRREILRFVGGRI